MDIERLMAERIRASSDRMMDEAMFGNAAVQAEPSVLTVEHFERIFDALTTDSRILITRNVRPFRSVPGWKLQRAKGEPGYWFTSRTGPRRRIKVYCSDYGPPDGEVIVADTTPLRIEP